MSAATVTSATRPGDALEELARQLAPGTVLRRDEPLARRTTLRVGGPADLYVEPASESDLAALLQYCTTRAWPVFVLGRGSNLIVRDGGFRGVVICLAHAAFSRIEMAGSTLVCGAGARLKAVANEARRRELAGFEFLEGIPGSIGGALRMNAGAMGGSIFDLARSVRLMDHAGAVRTCAAGELSATYRNCPALEGLIALSVVLEGRSGRREEIETRMSQFSRKRWASQPAAPSAGCMFKNPLTVPAGRLIDELGLKGTRVGGAMISHEHGNFLVTDGTATARDVLELLEVVRERARAERGLELETEVQIIGE